MLTTPLRWLVAALVLATPTAHALDASGSAFGTQLDLNAQLLLVQGNAGVSPTPHVSHSGTTAYGPIDDQSVGVQASLLGTQVLSTGVLRASTTYDPLVPSASSRGGVDNANVNLQLTPLVPLVGIQADSVVADASITGVCGALTAQGSTALTNARVTALGGGLLNLPASPAPNTTVSLANLINTVGLSLVLNEQTQSGDARNRTLTVNALHLRVDVNVLGALNANVLRLQGDVILGQAVAHRGCAAGDGPNLTSTKTASPLPAKVGQNLVFALKVANTGNQPAALTQVTDAVDPAFTVGALQASGSGSCSRAGQVVTCSWPTVAAGAFEQASVSVVPTQVGTFANAMTARFSGPDASPGDDVSTIQVPVQAADPEVQTADFSVQKTASQSQIQVGQNVSFALAVHNAGPDAGAATVSDALPSGLTFVSASAGSGGSCSGTAPVVCSWPSLAAGSTASATVVARAAQAGTFTNTATTGSGPNTTDPASGNNSGSATVVVSSGPSTASADFSVTKTASAASVVQDAPLGFTLTVRNAGPDAAPVSLTDALPAGVTFQSASATGGGTCSGTATIACNWTSVAANASVSVTLQTVPTASGTLTNTASVLAGAGAADPNPGNNSGSVSVTVTPVPSDPVADFGIQQTVRPQPGRVGELLTFDVQIANEGPSAAPVSFRDALDPSWELMGVTPTAGGSCSGSSPVVCSWATVPAGQTVGAVLSVLPQQAGSFSNTATVVLNGNTTDPDLSNNTSTSAASVQAVVNPDPEADLALSGTVDRSDLAVGQTVSFALEVANEGPDASPVRLSDTLDAAFDFVSVTADHGGSCSGNRATVCTWGAVAAGDRVRVLLTARALRAGTVANLAVVASGTTAATVDPDPSNNSVSHTVQIANAVSPGASDLGVTKEAIPSVPRVGNPVSFLVSVTNHGPDSAGGPLGFEDVLDPRLNVQSAAADNGGRCTVQTGRVRCEWDGLAVGTTAKASILAIPSAVGEYRNAVTVGQPNTDPSPGNDTTEVKVSVIDPSVMGNASTPPMCRAERRLGSVGSGAPYAALSYGGGEAVFATAEGVSTVALVQPAPTPRPLVPGLSGPNAMQVFATSRDGTRAVVRSGFDLAGNRNALPQPGWFLVAVGTGAAARLPDLGAGWPGGDARVAINGDGSVLFFGRPSSASTDLLLFHTASATEEPLLTLAGGTLTDLRLSASGTVVAFASTDDVGGLNPARSSAVFVADARSGTVLRASDPASTAVRPGTFDGAGRRLALLADGRVQVFDRTTQLRTTLDPTGPLASSPLMMQNGTEVRYLAPDAQGSLEIRAARVDGTGSVDVLTRFARPGSPADRLLDHDGAGQSFLLATDRNLLNESVGLLGTQVFFVDCDSIRAGPWFNPLRSGAGFDVTPYRTPGGNGLAIIWETYAANGLPTWYVAGGERQGRGWNAPLYRARGKVGDAAAAITQVGSIAFVFRDAQHGLVQWTLDGQTHFEPVEFLRFGGVPASNDDTGQWFDGSDSRAGISVSHQGNTRAVNLYTFDTAGNPTWGSATFVGDQHEATAYVAFGPGLCPGCSPSPALPSFREAGSFSLKSNGLGELRFGTRFQLVGSPSILWLRPETTQAALGGQSP